MAGLAPLDQKAWFLRLGLGLGFTPGKLILTGRPSGIISHWLV